MSYPAVVSQSPGQDKSRMSRWEHILSSETDGHNGGSYIPSFPSLSGPKHRCLNWELFNVLNIHKRTSSNSLF